MHFQKMAHYYTTAHHQIFGSWGLSPSACCCTLPFFMFPGLLLSLMSCPFQCMNGLQWLAFHFPWFWLMKSWNFSRAYERSWNDLRIAEGCVETQWNFFSSMQQYSHTRWCDNLKLETRILISFSYCRAVHLRILLGASGFGIRLLRISLTNC